MQVRSDGFTLIEVIIASLIFFLGIAVISQTFGIAFHRIDQTENKEKAARITLENLSYIIEKKPLPQKKVRVLLKENENIKENIEEFPFYKINDQGVLLLPKIR